MNIDIKQILIQLLIFFPLLILQFALIPFLTLWEITPDLIIVYVVLLTLIFGQNYGMVAGFLVGFVIDLVIGNGLGRNMLIYTICGFASGFFYFGNVADIKKYIFKFSYIVFITGIISTVSNMLIVTNPYNTSVIRNFLLQVLAPNIYTSIISTIFISLVPRKYIYE